MADSSVPDRISEQAAPVVSTTPVAEAKPDCGGACCKAAELLREAYAKELAAKAAEAAATGTAPAPIDVSKIEGVHVAAADSMDMPGTGHTMTINANGEIMHTMDGIPAGMAIGGVIAIILVSHLFVNLRRSAATAASHWTFNILQFAWLKKLVRRPSFPIMLQSLSVLTFILICSAGIFGSQRTNIAPVLTWTWWWVLLIFLILGFGKAFCSICPWEAFAAMITSMSLDSRMKKLGLDKRWPRPLRNIFPALGLFILLTWFELGHDVTRSPMLTAVLALVMLAMAVAAAIIFERRAFCRYGCLVGRISGLYSLFSPVELRPIQADVCRSCTTKDCYKGNTTATGCPTHLFPGNLKENTYCTLCTECVRACPHDNIAINIRPPATDLLTKVNFQWDEAILAIVLLALTSFHGVTMIPQWQRLNDLLRVQFSVGPQTIFTLLMVLMIMAPILLFWATAATARALTRDAAIPTRKIFKAFAYSVIPVALFYHLAHNGMHFFMEAQHLIPILSDPLGRGWNLFGTAGREYGELLPLRTIWWLQISLVVIGHIYGVVIADRIARRLFAFRERKYVVRSLIPLLVTMVLYSCLSVWLIAQPMAMRTGM